MRKYGVSVVSLVPWAFLGLGFSIDTALSAGFDGIQELPLRYKRYTPEYSRFAPWIISVEDAWNYGTFLQMVGRTFGWLQDPAPTYKDFILFGQQSPPEFQGAISSRHTFMNPLVSGSVTEIHPELSTDHNDYIRYADSGGKLTWDTHHVVRSHRVTGETLGNWRNLLRDLPLGSIGLVHFQPQDVPTFLTGDSEQIDMLLALEAKIGPEVPVIVEVPNVWESRSNTIKHLNLILENLKLFI